MEMGRRSFGIGIQPCSAHCSQSFSPEDNLPDPQKDLIEMGIVKVSALNRFVDPDVVSTPERARWFPVEIDRHDHPGRGRDDFHWFSGKIVEPVLVRIADEKVMAGMAFMVVAIEEIVAPDSITIAVSSSNRVEVITFQGETESLVSFLFFWKDIF